MKIICLSGNCPNVYESTSPLVSIDNAVENAKEDGWYVDDNPPEELMRGLCPDCLKSDAMG